MAYRLCRVLAIALLAQLSAAAWAQDLRWDVSVGFRNTYREGAWVPVFVDIQNEGGSRTGEIVVPVSYGLPVAHTVDYAVSVDLPQNSRKRYTLYVPSEEMEQISLKLSGARRETRKLPSGRIAGPADTLVVVIGGDPGLLNFLAGTNAVPALGRAVAFSPEEYMGPSGAAGMPEAVIQVGHTDWAELPESWLAWDGVDAVVLGDAGFADASPEALAALLNWVELGGTLVVPGGALTPQMASSAIADLLPIQLSSTATLPDLSPLADYAGHPIEPQPVLVASGRLRDDTVVLCGSPDQPLIAARSLASGRVVLSTFDFGAAPVKYWDGQTEMWPRLLAQAPARASLTATAEQRERWFPGMSLAEAAVYTPGARLPPIWLILGFLGAYIVVLVPVNYHVLKRLDRRELAWVTTPAIVIFFTVLAYAVGYGMRGGELVLNRLGVVEAAANTGLARGRGYVGIFSPGRAAYDLLLEGSAAGARDLAHPGERTPGTPTVQYGPAPKVSDLAMNMWTTRALCVEFLADLDRGIDGFLEYDGADLRALVTNNTSLHLRQARIVQEYMEGAKKDIRPGQAVEIAFGHGTPIADPSQWYPGSGPLRSKEPRQAIAEMAVAAVFGETYGPSGRFTSAARPYLVAISHDPLVPVKLDRRRPETTDANIIIVQLPIRLSRGRQVAVPSSLIARRLIVSEGRVSPLDPWEPDFGFTIEQGSAVFEFEIPLGAQGGRATALSLSAPVQVSAAGGGTVTSGRGRRPRPGGGQVAPSPAPGAPSPAPGIQFSAYNYALGRWDSLPAAAQPINIPDPANHMSGDGRVLVQLAIPSGEAQVEDLSLHAEVTTF